MSRPLSTPSSLSLTAALVSKSYEERRSQSLEANARCPRGTGLLLFDLDDTIVQSGSYVSTRVFDALQATRDAGFVLSIASGRPLCIVNKSILQRGVMHYAVCANGSSVIRLSDGMELVRRTMSRDDALDCYDMLAEFKPAWNGFFDGKAYFEWKGASYMLTGRTGAIDRASRSMERSDGTSARRGRSAVRRACTLGWRGMRYVVRMMTGGKNRQVLSLRRHLTRAREGVGKMGCTIPDARTCARAAELLRADDRFEVVTMGATELEITARGVSKGSGTQALMDELGIERGRAVAFGDGGNDLPLASVVGRFVAMGNADDEVKDAAFEVCPSVFDDGVAVWIENMLAAGGLEEGRSYV